MVLTGSTRTRPLTEGSTDALGELLARLYLPDRRWTLSELHAATGISMPTLTREVMRMVTAGLLTEEHVGRTRQVMAACGSRVLGPLVELLNLTYGPVPVLEDELAAVPGVTEAYIYGSWAARHAGIEGPEPNDVDVLVIGSPDRDALDSAAEQAEGRLRREVNIRRVSPAAWEQAGDTFLRNVRAGPLVRLQLSEETP